MPIATLKFPRSLTTQGKTFRKGVSEPISNEIGEKLRFDARFEIKGLVGDEREDRVRLTAGVEGGRPPIRAVRLEHIRMANDTLDPDVTENYTVDGLPSIAGLAKAMGWTPEENEIREALRIKRRSGVLADDGDSVAAAQVAHETQAPVITMSETSARIAADAPIPNDAAEAFVPKEDLIKAPIGKGGIKIQRVPRAKVEEPEVAADVD